MKRKTTYSLLVITILMGSLIPLQTQAISDVVEWHSSLTIGTEVAWRITEQYLFDTADPHSLAGEDIWVGSVLSYEINDTLPIYYDDVYSTSMPPDFLKLYVNYKEISFFDIDGTTEPSFALQYMILPYLFFPVSGETYNITQFLEHRAALDPNITAIDYVMIGGYYISVSIYNDFMSSFQITINNNTGIVADFFIEDDFGELYGQLDIWESDIDDAGVSITNTLNFHPNLIAGTELAWKYTEITYEPTASGKMEINNVTLEVGHVFSFVYEALPVDPLEYYGGDYFYDPSASFFDVYFEGDLAEFDNITRAQQVLWVTLTNPLSATLYNLDIVSMEDIHIIRDVNDPGILNTMVYTVGDTMNLVFDFIEENDNWSMELNININSGIAENLAIDILGFVHFEMEFDPVNSSLLIDGSENPDYPPGEDNGDTTRTLPGFNWFYLLFSTIAVLPFIRRRKK